MASNGGMKISFGVKRKEDTKLVKAAKDVIEAPVDSDEERRDKEMEREVKRRKLTQFIDGDVIDDDKRDTMVIPLVVENDWRVQKLIELEKEGKATEDDKAKLAILMEEKPFQAQENTQHSSIVVGEDRAQTVDPDYEAVPLESFGLAILRGCGWEEGKGIGKNPQVVKIKIPERRAKGLGLGATPKAPEGTKNDKSNGTGKEKNDAPPEIRKDSLIKITTGKHEGLYGKVESRDDDNNALYVVLALGGQRIKVPMFSVESVSSKEYERDSKCLNRATYEKRKATIDSKLAEESRREDRRESSGSKRKDDGAERNHKQDSRSISQACRSTDDDECLWVRPDLIVRFISRDYKGGRFYNQKVRVVDVASRKEISLEVPENGKMVYGVRQSWLETVIPRNVGERILLLRGKRAGQKAVMESKEKSREKVVARIIHTDEVLMADFDDVCLYQPRHGDSLIDIDD